MWKVWIFLAPLCPICQDYTFYLNSMYTDWEQEYPGQIEMVGWFPNPTVTTAEITEFRERYAVEWELERDTVGWSDGLSAKESGFKFDPILTEDEWIDFYGKDGEDIAPSKVFLELVGADNMSALESMENDSSDDSLDDNDDDESMFSRNSQQKLRRNVEENILDFRDMNDDGSLGEGSLGSL